MMPLIGDVKMMIFPVEDRSAHQHEIASVSSSGAVPAYVSCSPMGRPRHRQLLRAVQLHAVNLKEPLRRNGRRHSKTNVRSTHRRTPLSHRLGHYSTPPEPAYHRKRVKRKAVQIGAATGLLLKYYIGTVGSSGVAPLISWTDQAHRNRAAGSIGQYGSDRTLTTEAERRVFIHTASVA